MSKDLEKVLALAQKISDNANLRIARVREIHKPHEFKTEVCEYCYELYGCSCCSFIEIEKEFYWPCRTIRALDGDADVR